MIIYVIYTNRIIGNRCGSEGQFIKIKDVSYIESNVHKHKNTERSSYMGKVKYENGTKSKVYKIKNCKDCILVYDGTPMILIKE